MGVYSATVRSLSPERIVEAGVALVGASGWSALSLRAVATELQVTPMAMYRHVADSEALRAAVLDHVVDGLAHPDASGDLSADLIEWARRFRSGLDDHPGVAAHLLTAWFGCPPMLERVEELLALVADDGVTGFEAVAATNALIMYVLMRSEAERVVRAAGVVRRTLRTASTTRDLPHLRSLSEHYTTARFDAHFEYGLAALVVGMRLSTEALA